MTREELKRSLALSPRALCAFAVVLGRSCQTLASASASDVTRALRSAQTRVDARASARLNAVLERVEREGLS